MTKSIDFYFDFVSPYTFISFQRIKALKFKKDFKFRFKPILLGGLHNLHKITAPAFIPAKARFMIRDCKMLGDKYKISFKFNSYFPIKTVNLMRGVLIAEEDGVAKQYIDKIFDALWVDGLNLNDQAIIDKVLKNLDINPRTFALRLSNQNLKDELKKRTQDAFEKGIFGAPTFYVNNKVFWGQDRLEFALAEYLK
ncbi:2-hydroxychromene-2-carboxylate isomerase [Pelagibacteraceae bacterium]|nr:2-hydroxychromene-2-carboxylate isomerase [Pelagibacteraceae bacterium]